ncbi:MAG: rhamnulokinase [Clostridia bacterium]|nr:rhamnulokinase [Clostridia bacterium]
MTYHLAIDIGASSGRHILAHLESGKMVTEEIYRFQNGPKQQNGHLYWDTGRLFQEIVNGLKRARELGKIPATVAVDTWGVDYVLLDKNDNPVGETYCYRDHRTKAVAEAVHAIIPFAELYRKTGIQFQLFNTVYQLFDDKKTGRMEKAESFLNLPDYFHFRLTGVKRQEYTMATTTGMVNAVTRDWDGEILDKLGFKKELFVPLTQPTAHVGVFSKEIEREVGYAATVVLPATHDTASAVLAAPLSGRMPYISSGTWSLLGVEQTFAHTDETALKSDYSNEGSLGGDFRLQKNIMGLWMIQQVRHETGDKYSFAEFSRMAEENPVDVVIDVNENRFLAPENMTEEIAAAAGRSLTLGETAFVIFDSLARFYAESLSALEKITGECYATLNIIGGGSKNAFLNRLTEKYTGKKIITGPTECTAIGNLMLQMIGYGAIESVDAGRKIVKNSFDIVEL